MRVLVKKWGNSASVRIPAAIMEATQLRLDDAVNIREDDGCIVIEPIHPKRYKLSQLLSGITVANRHGEASFGTPVGKESF